MRLEVNDVKTYYGESYVLQGASLEVPSGSLVTLMGRNGVGKTTMIRSITGLTPPQSGSITIDGEEITGLRTDRIARKGIGLVPQGREVFPTLSVEENLTIGSSVRDEGPWNLDAVYQLFPNLKERRRNRANQLSGGEQQMLAIGRALMMNPRLLLLDEPSEGLAPLLVRQVGEVVRELHHSGISVLLVEQNLKLALDLAEKVYIMQKGQIVYEGTAADLAADEEAQHHYLGIG